MRMNQKAFRRLQAAVVAACAMIGAAGGSLSPAQAAPLDATRVAGDASVVLHLDIDRLRETKAYEQYLAKLIGDGGALPPEIAQFTQETGVNVTDLHDVTAYALSDPNHLLFVVHAKMDPSKVTAAIKKEAGETTEAEYGKYKVLRWGEGDEAVRASFHGDGATLVLARSDDDLHKALDALDGSADRLKPDSLLVGKSATATKPAIDAQERPVFFISAIHLDKLAKAIDDGDDELPALVKQVSGGWLTLGETGGDVIVRAAVATTDVESAQTMQQALDGLKAIITLAAGSDSDPELKIAKDLLRGVSTSRAEKELSLRIAIPLGKLPEMLKSLNVEADDKGEPGEKHRVRLQLKVGDDKEAKELDLKNKQLLKEKEKEKQDREKK